MDTENYLLLSDSLISHYPPEQLHNCLTIAFVQPCYRYLQAEGRYSCLFRSSLSNEESCDPIQLD
jgi:hypothetical protein